MESIITSRHWASPLILIVCLAFTGCLSADDPTKTGGYHKRDTITLARGKLHTVPPETIYVIHHHEPPKGIHTSDIFIRGRFYVGGSFFEAKKVELTFQIGPSQPVYVLAGSTLSLGDTRPALTVIEYKR